MTELMRLISSVIGGDCVSNPRTAARLSACIPQPISQSPACSPPYSSTLLVDHTSFCFALYLVLVGFLGDFMRARCFSDGCHASVFFACGVRFCLRLRVRLVTRLVLLMLQPLRLLPWLLLRGWSMSFMRMRLRVLLRLLPLQRP